jgi:hypothetical protein
VGSTVFDKLVRAAEVVSAYDEDFDSAGAEVHVLSVDIVVDPGNMVCRTSYKMWKMSLRKQSKVVNV